MRKEAESPFLSGSLNLDGGVSWNVPSCVPTIGTMPIQVDDYIASAKVIAGGSVVTTGWQHK
jgi:hypothetical protein